LRKLRWRIAVLLFVSTVINYIDRQTLSVLAPFLQRDYHWTNADFATVLIAFRLGYTIMQGAGGRLLDVVGTRTGLTLTVTFYSVIACMTSLAGGLTSFRVFRFLLGCGEGPNWPGATKATSEWFPARERAWAVAFFDSGSSIGGAVAPFLVLFLYHSFGNWRPAFLITGSLGFVWLVVWRKLYFTPEQHPRISEEERRLILESRNQEDQGVAAPPRVPWLRLLRYRQTWGIATFAYAACSTMFLSLPADIFESRAVASVSGLGGTVAGIATLVSTYWIGRITDRMSFQPIIIVASLTPLLATLVLVTMTRSKRSDGVLRRF
jgi:ACS family hexuronate transporter-like MFS transporter